MLGTSHGDRVRNQEIRRTRVTDEISRMIELGNRKNVASGLYFGDPEKKKTEVESRSQRRWTDDIKEEVGRSWFQIAQYRQKWKRQGKAYVQKRMEEG